MPYTTHTNLLLVDSQQPQLHVIQQAADCLLAGGLVAFPTETVYGLGANALNAEAVQRIYSAKGRPANNPLIAHITSLDQLKQVARDIPQTAFTLAEMFWPGPLTLVLKRQSHVPDEISAGRDTIAVRMPAHRVAQALISAAGVPVVAPSANRFTRPSATTAQHVLEDLSGHVDIILDGGPTPIGVESTVLDLTVEPPMLLRPGGVTLEALRAVLPAVQVHEQIAADDEAHASPGMMLKHYSPQAEVLLFSGELAAVKTRMIEAARTYAAENKRVGLLALTEDLAEMAHITPVNVALGSGDALDKVAQNLFAALRELDAQGVDIILVRQFAAEGLGRALADRLLRAAEGKVIEV